MHSTDSSKLPDRRETGDFRPCVVCCHVNMSPAADCLKIFFGSLNIFTVHIEGVVVAGVGG